jgi:hypothetical protein
VRGLLIGLPVQGLSRVECVFAWYYPTFAGVVYTLIGLFSRLWELFDENNSRASNQLTASKQYCRGSKDPRLYGRVSLLLVRVHAPFLALLAQLTSLALRQFSFFQHACHKQR